MAKVKLYLIMEIYMKVNYIVVNYKVMENQKSHQNIYMKDILWKINLMEKERKFIKMEEYMKVNFEMVKNKVLEC